MFEEEHGDISEKFHQREKMMEKVMDSYATKIQNALSSQPKLKVQPVSNAEDIAWAKVLNGCLMAYFIMTVFSSLMRPDFLSLTCIALAYMAANEPLRFGRRVFRIVVGMLVATFVYDLIWLFIIRSSQAEDVENGGQGGLIRGLSIMMAYISFFFRIVVIAVFWKVSLNYSKIIRQPALDDESPHAY